MANDISFENRQIAITKVLRLEHLSSMLVKNLIGISVNKKTKSLDNKSSALSLKSKLDLLLDTDKINKETYKYLLLILSIRNQFAHNYSCNNFKDLSLFIDGIDKHLLSFSDEGLSKTEEKLKSGFVNMTDGITFIMTMELVSLLKDLDSDFTEAKNQLVENYAKTLELNGVTDDFLLESFRKKAQEIILLPISHELMTKQLKSAMKQCINESA